MDQVQKQVDRVVLQFSLNCVKGNVVRTNVYHKYIKDLKLNITIDLDGFIYYPSS